MMAKNSKTLATPWPDAGSTSYTDKELRRMAIQAAREQGGKLLDYRVILQRDGNHCLQTRYLLKDGIARYHNTAI